MNSKIAIALPTSKAKIGEGKLPLLSSISLIFILAFLYFYFPGVKAFFIEAWFVLASDDEKKIKSWVENFSWFGPVILILAMICQMFLIFIPTLALLVVCILAYGPVYGGFIALIAFIAASSVGYGIGRFIGPSMAEKLIGIKSVNTGRNFLNSYGIWAIFITRINPFLSNDAVSLISGILKMNYWSFIFASIAGIAPLILFIAIFGETTDELKTNLLWSSLATLLLMLIFFILKKRGYINLFLRKNKKV